MNIMNVPTVIAVIGGIALLVGIFGGGIQAKEIKIPKLEATIRVFSATIGVALIATSVALSSPKTPEASPSSLNLSVSELSPTATAIQMQVDIGTINISASNSSGTQWCPQISATYAIEYESGTYSPWPDDTGCEDGCWTTAIYAYQNRNVEWVPHGGNFEPGNPDFRIGWENRHVKPKDAEMVTRTENNRFETSLDIGQCLTFIALDGQPNYDGNRGTIILRVKIIGQ